MIPVVYFSILFLFIYRKKKQFDLSCLVLLLYWLTSVFGLLNESLGLRYGASEGYSVTLNASIAYCFLLTICIIPIHKYSESYCLRLEPIGHQKLLKVLSSVGALYFVIFLFLASGSIINALTGDMQAMRADIYNDVSNQDWMKNLPTIIRLPCSLMNLFFGCPWILLLLAFYSYTTEELPAKYCLFFVLASFIDPLNGIVGLDRSKMTYWIIQLVACYIVFRRHMSTKQKKNLRKYFTVVVALFVLYLMAMTIQRFSEKSVGSVSGTEAAFISYLGQPYVNFCYFYDTYSPIIPTLQKIFPFTYEYIIGTGIGSSAYNLLIYERTGVFLGVFYTFIGDIIISGGKTAAIIYCLLFALISLFVMRNNKQSIWSIKRLFILMAFASVLYLGIFTHYYAASYRTFSLFAFYMLISLFLSKRE